MHHHSTVSGSVVATETAGAACFSAASRPLAGPGAQDSALLVISRRSFNSSALQPVGKSQSRLETIGQHGAVGIVRRHAHVMWQSGVAIPAGGSLLGGHASP